MRHYVVTGACGFIGSRTAEFLLRDGHRVTGIDNLNEAYDNRLKYWRLRQLAGNPNFEHHQLDICDAAGICELFQSLGQIDGVVNLAARAGVRASLTDPISYIQSNVIGTTNVLQACEKCAVEKFVLSSTSSVYAGTEVPYLESHHSSRPLSPYAASKKAAEELAYVYHHIYGLDITILRYFTVYGPAGRPDMAPLLFTRQVAEGRPIRIFGDGSQSRDFTYIDDIAKGTIDALKPLGFEIINLGSDNPVTVMELIHLIEEATDMKAMLQFEAAQRTDVQSTWADVTRAHDLLNWEPETKLRDGISFLARWYYENRDWLRDAVAS
jgi:UDP-glucuronate 4-epimerase